ncbi:hypothetical protein PIB30_052765 [Stylosanthes scabra]|uniref:Uncharacterized protein n=1 Tax=Stylosanthes scabra TaxID=79078 RepID=A0ABU6ZH69_9FABA|nr:hypothetical protein [Stylosanthes scabra]
MGRNCMRHAIVILIIGVVICCCNNGEFEKVRFDDITIKDDESSKKYITMEEIGIAECVKKCQQELYDFRKKRCILNCCMEECGKHFPDAEFWPCVTNLFQSISKGRDI